MDNKSVLSHFKSSKVFIGIAIERSENEKVKLSNQNHNYNPSFCIGGIDGGEIIMNVMSPSYLHFCICIAIGVNSSECIIDGGE